MSATAPTDVKQRSSLGSSFLWPWQAFAGLYRFVPPGRRRQLFALLGLMLLNAVAELGSIGAIVPFLSLLAGADGLDRFPWVARLFEALGATSGSGMLVTATIAFASFVTMSGALRLRLAWLTQDFVFGVGHDISVEAQRRVLSQPYSFHIQRNSSTLVAAMEKTEQLTYNLLLPLLQASIAAVLALFIIGALLYIDPFVAGVAATTFLAMYVLVSRFARRRLQANSAALAEAWDDRLKTVQESFGGIRDVIIDGAQPTQLRLFEKANRKLAQALASNAFIASAPRFVIETAGMIVVAILALIISSREPGFAGALPILGAIALGAQRLLPLLQQVYYGWSAASGQRIVIGEVQDLLALPLAVDPSADARLSPVPLKHRISFDGVGFGYPMRRQPALEDVTFEILKGSSIALIGKTGSGKTTLADLLMGLLEPDTGAITIDDVPLTSKNRRRWQRSIAHVPQSIFLIDATIADNIALGLAGKEPDQKRIVEAAKMAQLHDFAASLPDGYDTVVGERGVRLSGGQRQRLGIARAIYKDTPILVLDEATSALDEETEAAVLTSVEELGGQGRTIIIIAHRQSTIARCDKVFRLDRGRIVDSGSFEGVTGKKTVTTRGSRPR